MDFIHTVMIVGGLGLGGIAGIMMHRADYCVAGMFRDLFLFRSTMLLKTLLLLVAVSLPIFGLIQVTGLVATPFPTFKPPSWVNLLGGLLFGVGMVIAGGCAVGTLYKLGAGSFSSMLAFFGLVAGSTFYAEIHPWWSTVAKSLALPTKATTMPQLLGVPTWLMVSLISLFLLPLLLRWLYQGRLNKPVVVNGYLQPWKAAVGLALVGSLSVLIIGKPMSITTSYAKIGAMVLKPLAPEHFESLSYFHRVTLETTPPLSGLPMFGGPGPAFDAFALVQFPLIIGIVLGAAWSAIRLGEWHMQFKLPWRQVLSALLGGIIMGLASRMTPSCNVWHLFGGLPFLALQSFLFLAGLLPGAWLGGIILTRLVLPR